MNLSSPWYIVLLYNYMSLVAHVMIRGYLVLDCSHGQSLSWKVRGLKVAEPTSLNEYQYI